jgi:Nucleotide modification associated domain 2
MPRLFTYVIPNDGGFAPNPFFGACTLNCQSSRPTAGGFLYAEVPA